MIDPILSGRHFNHSSLISSLAAAQATKNEPPELAARSVKQGGVKVLEDGLTPPLMIEKP